MAQQFEIRLAAQVQFELEHFKSIFILKISVFAVCEVWSQHKNIRSANANPQTATFVEGLQV